jgi:hypothetical protein
MTCQHQPGDPACGSYARERAAQERHNAQVRENALRDALAQMTQDASRFEIVDAVSVGAHLVLKVKYPNCDKCAYEGHKVMVFLNTTAFDALKWRTIDPHFRAPDVKRLPSEAPSPAARFPASSAGWTDACAWAERKAAKV